MVSASVKVTAQEKLELMDLAKDLMALAKTQVLVGVPAATSDRTDDGPNNAFLAYVHDNGSPVAGIPARPFMKPGIQKAQNRISKFLMAAAKCFLEKDDTGVEQALMSAGLVAQGSIRNVINEGEGFAPLKRSTLLGRTRKRAYAWWRIEEGNDMTPEQRKSMRHEQREALMGSMHPLVDTGQLRNSINFVIRKID